MYRREKPAAFQASRPFNGFLDAGNCLKGKTKNDM
ncbi:hypothetical protein Q675_03290 [Labrenzia sp. C1B70]|nr:hypothetical protein Q675_03290 [Labrenzia sp. C1B70]